MAQIYLNRACLSRTETLSSILSSHGLPDDGERIFVERNGRTVFYFVGLLFCFLFNVYKTRRTPNRKRVRVSAPTAVFFSVVTVRRKRYRAVVVVIILLSFSECNNRRNRQIKRDGILRSRCRIILTTTVRVTSCLFFSITVRDVFRRDRNVNTEYVSIKTSRIILRRTIVARSIQSLVVGKFERTNAYRHACCLKTNTYMSHRFDITTVSMWTIRRVHTVSPHFRPKRVN